MFIHYSHNPNGCWGIKPVLFARLGEEDKENSDE